MAIQVNTTAVPAIAPKGRSKVSGDAFKVTSLDRCIAAIVGAFISGGVAIANAETALLRAQGSQLSSIHDAVKRAKVTVTEAAWSKDWFEAVRTAVKVTGVYSDKTLPSMLSRLKRAVIFLSNGIAPEPKETLAAYVTRASATAEAKGLITVTQGKGGGTGKKPAKKGVVTTVAKKGDTAANRKAAATLLCEGMDPATAGLVLAVCIPRYAAELPDLLRKFIAVNNA